MIAAFHTNDTGITMAGRIDARLKELKIELPEPTEPSVAKIRNAKMANGFLFVSGQVPRMGGKISFVGKVGREFDLARARKPRAAAPTTCSRMPATRSAAISTASSRW